MAKKKEVSVEYKLINTQFNSAIKTIQSEMNSLNKAFRLQKEQMKLNASESEKLTVTLEHLKEKQKLAKDKVEETKNALENAKKVMGENSIEAKKWSDKLLDAQRAEASIKNEIENTNQKLKEAAKAESEAAKASEDRRNKLSALSSEQERLSSKTDALTAKYNSQVSALGNNAKESDKLKLRQDYLKSAMENTEKEVSVLKDKLEIAKKEFGDNSTEVNKLEKELAEATQKVRDFKNEYDNVGNSVKAVSDKLSKTGKVVSGIGDSYTKRVSLPMIAGIGATIKVASDMEKAFTGVRKTVDEVRDKNGKLVVSYADLEKGIIDMSKTMPTSAVQIASVAEAAGQLGVKGQDIIPFTKTMVQMGESTNLSATDAATAIARFTNIMGGSLKNVDRMGAAIVHLGNNYATTESEITQMSLRLAGAGRQIGLSEQNILALSTAMTSLGIEAESGGSSMSKVMTKMQNAVMGPQKAMKAFEAELQKVGLSYQDVQSAVEKGGKTLEEMAEKTGYSKSALKDMVKEFDDGTSRIELFSKVSGMSSEQFAKTFKEKPIEAIQAFIRGLGKIKENGGNVNETLTNLGITELRETDTLRRLSGASDLLSKAVDDSNKAWKENTALKAEAEKRNEPFAGKMGILKNNVLSFMNDAGKPFADALINIFDTLKPVLQGISDLAKKFNDADPATKKMVVAIAGIAIAFGPVMSVFGRFITGLGTLTGAWATAFGGAEAATPAVAGLAKVLKGLSKLGGPLKTIFGGVFKGIAGVFSKLLPLVSGAFQGVIGLIVANPIAAALAVAVAALIFIWVKWGDDIKAFFAKHWEGVKQTFVDGWNAVKDTITDLWNGFIEGAKPIWEALKNVFEFIWLAIKEVFNIGWLAISTPIILAWQLFVAGAKAIWEPLSQFFSSMWNGIKEIATSVWQSISDFTMSIWQPISEFLNVIWSGISSTASTIFNGIKDTISSVFNFIDQNIIAPIWNNISGFLSKTWDLISSTASNVFNGVKDFFSRTWDNISSKASESWSSIRSNLGAKWDAIKYVAREKFDAIKSNISNTWDNLKRSTGEKWNSISGAVSRKMDDMGAFVKRGLDSISRFFSNCRLELPDIRLPHFSIDGEFSLDPPSIPHISVDWYKTGGIAKSASIVGIGEAGKEAVVPLEGHYMAPFAQAIADRIKFNNQSSGAITIILNQDVKETADFRKGVDIVDKELRRKGFKLNYGVGGA